jgi:hypothetical protein
MSSLSIGGKFRYYISFIDDFSRTWIYFLRGKSSEKVLLWKIKPKEDNGGDTNLMLSRLFVQNQELKWS